MSSSDQTGYLPNTWRYRLLGAERHLWLAVFARVFFAIKRKGRCQHCYEQNRPQSADGFDLNSGRVLRSRKHWLHPIHKTNGQLGGSTAFYKSISIGLLKWPWMGHSYSVQKSSSVDIKRNSTTNETATNAMIMSANIVAPTQNLIWVRSNRLQVK